MMMNRKREFSWRKRIIAFSSLPWQIIGVIIVFSVLLYYLPSGLSSASTVWPAPVILNPADGEITTVENYAPGAVPHFEWEPVSGAATYRIQIDNEIAFSTPIPYNVTTPNTRYIPTNNTNMQDGTLYWRVRVETPAPVGEWSEIRQFTKDWGTTGNEPTLLNPDANADIEFFEAPVFSWTPVVGAADYVLRIASDDNCLTTVKQYTTLATSYNPNTRLANANYYWCVTPRDPAGRNGKMSEVRPLNMYYAQTPQLLAPANGSVPAYTPTFRWTAVKGASYYKLQHSTDPNFVAALTIVTTRQTTYTPLTSFPNDQTRYWRVAAVYGSNWDGPYSEVWNFEKKWYHQPVLLTPLNNELTNVPLFTWTPVREARRYRVEASIDPGFNSTIWTADTANTFHWQATWRDWDAPFYWRVIPYDQNNNIGVSSEVRTFRPVVAPALPENIWPRYFYSPPSIPSGNYAAPRDMPISYDYTVDTPTFYWSRTFVPGADPRQEAAYYRLQVDDDPNFGSPEWIVLTENLSATPTDDNPFTPTANTNYYWRVTPYAASGNILTNTLTNQPWLTQIDVARQPAAAATTAPTLLAPQHGEKVFATLPSFEWQAQQDAVRYEFEISAAPDFATTAYLARTTYTRHTPVVRLPIGTYFWRVRGLNSSDATVGAWSGTRRVIVAMQTRWLGAGMYILGYLPELYDTLLAQDIDDGLGATELATLYTAQDKDNWLVGFHINPTPGTPVVYGLYLDANQQEANGASFAPSGRPALTTSSYYRPEYALYVNYTGSSIDTAMVPLYEWITNTVSWSDQIKNLVDVGQVGGAIYYTSTLQYVELKIPKTAIGDRGDKPFSLSTVLFSAPNNTATAAADTVPDNGPAPDVLHEFKTIGDQVTLSVPVGGLPGERPQLPYSPYLYAEAPNTDLVGGYRLQVARDPQFTSVIKTSQTTCTGCEPFPDIFLYMETSAGIYEDSTLYWRYAIRHKVGSTYYNAPPSEPHLFTKSGLAPDNLRVEGAYSNPRFVWDAVEGAGTYRLEFALNPDFSPLPSDQVATVNHESYTPASKAFAPNTYYWRVRANNAQGGSYSGPWSPISTFTITLPQVSLIEPVAGSIVHSAPVFKWAAFLVPGTTQTIGWGAPKYRLQVSSHPNFANFIDNLILDTITWAPEKSYPDGTYYWRVAVIDANNNQGPFSDAYTFTKQYPTVRLVAPLTGTVSNDPFLTFIWRPITTTSTAQYRIEIALNPQFSPLVDSATTNNTYFTPAKKYAQAQYYWRVAMIDKSGRYGPWTDSILLIDPYPYDIFLPLTLKNFRK